MRSLSISWSPLKTRPVRILGFCLLLWFGLSQGLFAESRPDYRKARETLPLAWERLYPLPFDRILKEDPKKLGIQKEKRGDGRIVYIYNFLVFMPKYDRNENEPKKRDEGREILVYFLWEPGNLEVPYRIQLGDLN